MFGIGTTELIILGMIPLIAIVIAVAIALTSGKNRD